MGSKKDNLFVYRGGKSGIASKIWELLGDPVHYFEPFGGSFSVLLNRPSKGNCSNGKERINDIDARVINFFRCCKFAKDELAKSMKNALPKCHIEAKSYAKWFKEKGSQYLTNALIEDKNFYDVESAVNFCYMASALINSTQAGEVKPDGTIKTGGFQYFNNGMFDTKKSPMELIDRIHIRLRNVTLYCNDWKFCIPPKSVMMQKNTSIGIYLDPPYKKYDYVYETAFNFEQFLIDVKERILKPMNEGTTLVISGHQGDYEGLKSDDVVFEEHTWDRHQQKNRCHPVTECLIKINKL